MTANVIPARTVPTLIHSNVFFSGVLGGVVMLPVQTVAFKVGLKFRLYVVNRVFRFTD